MSAPVDPNPDDWMLTPEDVAVGESVWPLRFGVSIDAAVQMVNEKVGHDGFYGHEFIRERLGSIRHVVLDCGNVLLFGPDVRVLAFEIYNDMLRRKKEQGLDVLPLPRRKWRTSGVYFAGCGAFVKIGRSGCVRTRLSELSASTPYTVECLAVIQYENDAECSRAELEHHERFAEYRYKREWFRHTGALADYVAGLPRVTIL